MTATYLDISKKRVGTDCVLLSNGDLIHKGGDGTPYQGQWFFIRKETKFVRRLPKATTREEALEEYQAETGNCIL